VVAAVYASLLGESKAFEHQPVQHQIDIVSTEAVESVPTPLCPPVFDAIELTKMKSSSVEIALVLRRLAESLERDEPTIVHLADEEILIPAKLDISCIYEIGAGKKEIKIRVMWDLFSSAPQLIRQHSECVQDTLGNLYDVFIYGEPRPDGTWEGWLEFVPLSAGLSSLRTDRETTQPDLSALEYWSTGLEPMYLAGAFERAKSA
jgi:hypothetical protein